LCKLIFVLELKINKIAKFSNFAAGPYASTLQSFFHLSIFINAAQS